jgi:hypothetical protein
VNTRGWPPFQFTRKATEDLGGIRRFIAGETRRQTVDLSDLGVAAGL